MPRTRPRPSRRIGKGLVSRVGGEESSCPRHRRPDRTSRRCLGRYPPLCRRKVMMKSMLVPSGLILALGAVPAARAQVTVDVAKITCDQFTGYKITNPDNIAMWLSGYYNGRRGNTILDTQGLAANTKKVRDY